MPTERRIYRVANALHKRQSDIIIALDGVHDQHNLSAVIRTADAVGIERVVWYPDVKKPEKLNPEVSKGAERWVSLEVVPDIVFKLKELKKEGYQIAATHMGAKAVDFRSIDYGKPWVIVLGNEQRGCSKAVLNESDINVFIPMMGFVQSLNISVAAAVIMYEIQRQREGLGLYNKQKSFDEVKRIFQFWALENENFTAEMLCTPPKGAMPELSAEHSDGRAVRKFIEIDPNRINER